MKLPWIKFWVNSWLSDESVRSCSLEARGLWIDMLALMAKSEVHGHLLIGGKPARAEQLARIVGLSPERTMQLMDELHASGVFSFDKETIISRRMVKDERVRKSGSERQLRFRNANVTQVKRICNTNETEQRIEVRGKRIDNTHTRTQLRPIRAEWIAYAKEIGWTGADVEGAFDYYESNGWKVGGKAPVKDWRACARNCQRRNQTKPMKGNQPMKKIVSQCESLPTYKVMGFTTREAWVKAGCP
jgi:hypothetical protein